MNKPFIYLASPYTHVSKRVQDYREREICTIAARLLAQGHLIYCPIAETAALARTGEITGTKWEYWREKDLRQVSVSDEVWVAMMDGWKNSKGIRGEVKFAILNNIPIRLVNPSTLRISAPQRIGALLEFFGLKYIHELND